MQFAIKLGEYISEPNTVMGYFDETSMHSQLIQRKVWYFKGVQLKIPSTKVRGKNFTVMGILSEALPDCGYFEVVPKTNKICFLEFMRNLRARILPEFRSKKFILVLDNHSAHKGPDRRELLHTFCIPTYIPA